MRSASAALKRTENGGGFQTAKTFYLRRLNLRPSLDALLRSFQKGSVQQQIRRAAREGLAYEAGRSEGAGRGLTTWLPTLRDFYT